MTLRSRLFHANYRQVWLITFNHQLQSRQPMSGVHYSFEVQPWRVCWVVGGWSLFLTSVQYLSSTVQGIASRNAPVDTHHEFQGTFVCSVYFCFFCHMAPGWTDWGRGGCCLVLRCDRWDCFVPLVAVAIFKVCADGMEGGGYVICCGSVGSESTLVRVRAGGWRFWLCLKTASMCCPTTSVVKRIYTGRQVDLNSFSWPTHDGNLCYNWFLSYLANQLWTPEMSNHQKSSSVEASQSRFPPSVSRTNTHVYCTSARWSPHARAFTTHRTCRWYMFRCTDMPPLTCSSLAPHVFLFTSCLSGL